MTVTVDYCGEQFHATEEQPLTIGRDADLDMVRYLLQRSVVDPP